nr:hypothetical protein [Tanacetum cinerariifolium]
MSSDSHATITYTSMSSYEVIVNGYYGMPMDPLDPYDDADDKDEEESSDSKEEKEEHLALTVPAPALYKVERLLAIPTPPLSPVSPTSYPLPPFLMPLPIHYLLHHFHYLCRYRLLLVARVFLRRTYHFVRELALLLPLVDMRLRRERRYFRTLSTTYAQERDVSTLQRQHIDDEDRLTRHIQHEHAQRDVTPEDGDSCS